MRYDDRLFCVTNAGRPIDVRLPSLRATHSAESARVTPAPGNGVGPEDLDRGPREHALPGLCAFAALLSMDGGDAG